ncbi:polycomb group RING finger protein 1 [Babesia caballi]|uniref:Polycomb group RING finger protein 1 n=1 Tax=Babesia caballi TaxID=5871 RepID=A0AAV4LZV2_BABCB|nr:polycomb group RING finger protein 1 [Babesia caballi]
MKFKRCRHEADSMEGAAAFLHCGSSLHAIPSDRIPGSQGPDTDPDGSVMSTSSSEQYNLVIQGVSPNRFYGFDRTSLASSSDTSDAYVSTSLDHTGYERVAENVVGCTEANEILAAESDESFDSCMSSTSMPSVDEIAGTVKTTSTRAQSRRARVDAYNSIAKANHARNMAIIQSWFNRLPIVLSKQQEQTDVQAEPAIGQPEIVEVANQLDVRFAMGNLVDILSCALCKGLFCNAHTIKECMHTFCKSCLVLYTVDNGYTCPTCSIAIPGGGIDGAEYDQSIQVLVDKLFPDFCKRENKQKELIQQRMGTEN